MNISSITTELSTKIEEFLTSDISEEVLDELTNYEDQEFKYDDIDQQIWDSIDDKVKQAFILYAICINEDEANSDSFALTYVNKIISEDDFNSIQYSNKYISNNNNPIFLIKNYNDIISFNKDLSLHFAKGLIDNWDNVNFTEGLNVFFPNCSSIQSSELVPYLKLLILSEGNFYHTRTQTNNCFLDSRIKNTMICPAKNYTQYTDILNILSEYNDSDDILQKYLLLYTILENFMYRKPISELVSQNSFTIRRFKELYKKVENDEISALKKLLNQIYTQNIFITTTVLTHIESEYASFIASNNTCETGFLVKLPFTTSNIKTDFARLVYILRNCIVHNKETEYHLTHFELNKIPVSKKFFEQFMLPLLENIIYLVLLDSSSFLDYNSPTINLYEAT